MLRELPLSNMDNDQLAFLLEIHKRIDMSFALSDIILGMNSGKSTKDEIISILKMRNINTKSYVKPKPGI
jgi:hypothetical protein